MGSRNTADILPPLLRGCMENSGKKLPAAKLAPWGACKSWALEGARYGSRVNVSRPTAATRNERGCHGERPSAAWRRNFVSPAVSFSQSERAPTAVSFARARQFSKSRTITLTREFVRSANDACRADRRSIRALTDRRGERCRKTARHKLSWNYPRGSDVRPPPSRITGASGSEDFPSTTTWHPTGISPHGNCVTYIAYIDVCQHEQTIPFGWPPSIGCGLLQGVQHRKPNVTIG